MIKDKNVFQVTYDLNNLEIIIESNISIRKITCCHVDSFNTELKRVYDMLKEYTSCINESEEDK